MLNLRSRNFLSPGIGCALMLAISARGSAQIVVKNEENLKWTSQYLRALPQNGSVLKPTNEITVQLQLMYF